MFGLVSVVEACRGLTRFEGVLAVDSLLFVASVFLTYLSSHSPQGTRALERMGDAFFAAGLVALLASTFLEFI